MGFDGFQKQTQTFLRGLTRNNKKAWFEAHRDDYERYYMEPARQFVVAMGESLVKLDPEITADPRVNKTIFRINRDVRFSRDKTPYKNHLDLWFYPNEERSGGRSGFFFRMFADSLILGAGVHTFDKKTQLPTFRERVADDKSGKALARALASVTRAGCRTGEPGYKKVPRGYDADHPRADLLRLDNVHAMVETKLPEEVHSKRFVAWCQRHFKKALPVHRWLREHME